MRRGVRSNISTTRWLGVVSDTHGLLRPEAVRALRGCERIVHAGDVGRPEVLDALNEIAPTVAVRGNVDRGEWAERLPLTEVVEFEGMHLYVLHDLEQLDLDPAGAGFATVISGHSHVPRIELRNGVTYLNPGAAGPRRFRLPVTLAKLRVEGGVVSAEIVSLKV